MIEIDGVVRELERPVSESGDYLADAYVRALDLSTAPDPLNAREQDMLASTIRRLNRNLATTSLYLSDSDCWSIYNDVAAQLNQINGSNPTLGTLKPLLTREEVGNQHSTRFKFYDVPANGVGIIN